MTTTNIHLAISGASMAVVLAEAAALGGKTSGGDGFAGVPTDDLLAELRDRLVKQSPPLIVKVEPFEDSQGAAVNTTTAGESTAQSAPQPDAAAKKAAKAATAAAAKAAKEAPKPTEPGTQAPAGDKPATEATDKASEWEDGPAAGAPPTKDQLVTALNAYSAVNGQAGARAQMEKVGGSARLADIPTDKWPALLTALTV